MRIIISTQDDAKNNKIKELTKSTASLVKELKILDKQAANLEKIKNDKIKKEAEITKLEKQHKSLTSAVGDRKEFINNLVKQIM